MNRNNLRKNKNKKYNTKKEDMLNFQKLRNFKPKNLESRNSPKEEIFSLKNPTNSKPLHKKS